jgi:hypothetical protein
MTLSPSQLEANFRWLFVSQGLNFGFVETFVFLMFPGVALLVLSAPGLFFPSKPPSPPSVSGHVPNGMTMMGELKYCISQPSFITLFIVLGVGYGMFVALWSVMQVKELGSFLWPLKKSLLGVGLVDCVGGLDRCCFCWRRDCWRSVGWGCDRQMAFLSSCDFHWSCRITCWCVLCFVFCFCLLLLNVEENRNRHFLFWPSVK